MRRKKTGISLQFYNSIAELPADWDALVPAGHYLKKDQLSVSENAQLPDITHIYILVYKGGRAIAAASFQALRLKKQHLNDTMVKPYQHLLWSTFTTMARPVLLVAGHLFRHDICSYYWEHTISAFEAFSIYKEAIELALCRVCAYAVLVKDVNDKLTTYFQNLAPEYFMLRNDISMEMAIPSSWESMADYERALKHKYAQRYRKIKQVWSKVSVKELSVEEVEKNKDKLYALYQQVSQKQQVRLGSISADYLFHLKVFNEDTLKIWCVVTDNEIVAFFSAWVKDEAFDMFYIGFDYDKNAGLQLYFNMLFFGLEQAILLKKEKLILGRTALDAKARIGCMPRYLNTFLYISNGVVRRQVLGVQQRASSKEGEWEQRHPLKEMNQ